MQLKLNKNVDRLKQIMLKCSEHWRLTGTGRIQSFTKLAVFTLVPSSTPQA
jgi:hypothetical protein